MPTMDDDEKLITEWKSRFADWRGKGCDPNLYNFAEMHTVGCKLADRLSALKAERDRMAAALGKLADDARWWKMPEVENQEYIADACMAMLRLMRACARAALSQEPTQ